MQVTGNANEQSIAHPLCRRPAPLPVPLSGPEAHRERAMGPRLGTARWATKNVFGPSPRAVDAMG